MTDPIESPDALDSAPELAADAAPETKNDSPAPETPPSSPVDASADDPLPTDALDSAPELAASGELVTIEMVHGSYHGPGCMDPDARAGLSKGYGFDDQHPAMLGERVRLTADQASKLVAIKVAKLV